VTECPSIAGQDSVTSPWRSSGRQVAVLSRQFRRVVLIG
jgi:hypothetical protein